MAFPTMMMDVAKKQDAVLQLVRQVLVSEAEDTRNAERPLLPIPERYEDFRDGAFFYCILARIAPHSFPDADEIAEQSVAMRQNWVVRKGNIISLLRHMDDYAHLALGAPETFNLSLIVNAAEIANSPMLGGDLPGGAECDKGMAHLLELTDIFVVMVVLSGDASILKALKSLLHPHQVALSNAAKACITKHALRPRRRNGTPATGDSCHSSIQRSAVSNRGGLSFCSTQRQQPPLLVDDVSLIQNLPQLQRELDDAKAKVAELESILQLAITEKQGWESKCRLILQETEQRRASFTSAEHLQYLLAEKDETVRSLTAAAKEHSEKIAALVEATVAHESALDLMKRKLRQTEDELIKKDAEKREALEKLAIAEDKLALQINARIDLEKEMEELRTEVTPLRVEHCNSAEGNGLCSVRSVDSINCIDRLVQLEGELDEVRSQKEAAERLLDALQRQVALVPLDGFKSSNAMDALKVQVRQAEEEKEALRNQLATAISKLEDMPFRLRDCGGGRGGNASETGSLIVDGRLDRRDVDEASADSPSLDSCMRDSHVDAQREHAVFASNLLLLGYRNLMLQQRTFLASGGHRRSAPPAMDERDDGRPVAVGSFLAQHRLEVEEGLMEPILGSSWRSR